MQWIEEEFILIAVREFHYIGKIPNDIFWNLFASVSKIWNDSTVSAMIWRFHFVDLKRPFVSAVGLLTLVQFVLPVDYPPRVTVGVTSALLSLLMLINMSATLPPLGGACPLIGE